MSIKTKAPEIKEDPQTVALRKQAEQRAETSRREEGQGYADSQTRKILRRFGMTAKAAGAPALGNFNPFVLSGLGLGAGFGGAGGGAGGLTPNFVRPTSGGLSLYERREAD